MATSGIMSALSSAVLGGGQGIDVTSAVHQMITAIRTPEVGWQAQQQGLQYEISTLNQLNSQISTLSDSVNALNDPAAVITARSATSSQPDILSASAANGAAPASHIVVVNNLATTSSYYSDPVATASTALAIGTFTIQVGNGQAATVTIDNTNNTLTQLAASINGQNLGVTANVVTDASGARLALVSNTGGASGDLTISNVANGLNFTKGVTGTNASLTVDGVPISSSSNQVTGAVSGLTLNLLGAAPGTQIQVSVSPDAARVTQAVTDFVSAYNAVITNLNSQFAYNSATKSAGLLAGDSSARMVQSQLLSAISYSATGSAAYKTLASIGVSMNNDGTLTVDNATLGNAITSNYAAVQNFFQGANGQGFASTLHTQLASLTDPTQGAFYVDIKGKTDTQNSLQDQIDNFEVYVTSQQQLLTTQYQRVDVMLRELPILQAQIQAELGFTNSSNSNNGK